MAPERRVWCTCTIIDYLAGKAWAEPCKRVVERAAAGAIEIVVSTLAEAEVVKLDGHLHADAEAMIDEFFNRSYIVRVGIDPLVARRARSIVRDLGLKPLDSVHVATAVEQEIPILETYDEGIIGKANGKTFDVEGRKVELIVRKPVWEEPAVKPNPQLPLASA